MPGTVVRVKGIKRYFEPKAGRWYCYHRATGKRLSEDFGSPVFFERLAELDKEARGKVEEAAKPNTLRAVILDYKQTDAFTDLARRTKADYEKVFTFLEPLWDTRLSAFTAPQLAALRNKWRKTRGRRFVNYVRAVLSIVFSHAVNELGLITLNPIKHVKQVRKPREAVAMNRPWTLEERQAAMTHLPSHIRLPVAIALFSGMREGDVITMPPTAINGNKIKVRTAKRNVWIDIPILPELAEALDAEKAAKAKRKLEATTLCTNSRGRPWTSDGFSCSFRKAMMVLEQRDLVGDGCTFHGLRHTVAADLAERGVSEEDIAAVLGQSDSKMARHYAKEADRSRRTTAAIKKFQPLGKPKEGRRKNKK
jgi:integrase